MRATMIDSHPRLPRQTGMSDYRGEEATRNQSGSAKYSMTHGSPDWHPRLLRRRGIEARPHSQEMHDRLDETTEEREAGYSRCLCFSEFGGGRMT